MGWVRSEPLAGAVDHEVEFFQGRLANDHFIAQHHRIFELFSPYDRQGKRLRHWE